MPDKLFVRQPVRTLAAEAQRRVHVLQHVIPGCFVINIVIVNIINIIVILQHHNFPYCTWYFFTFTFYSNFHCLLFLF